MKSKIEEKRGGWRASKTNKNWKGARGQGKEWDWVGQVVVGGMEIGWGWGGGGLDKGINPPSLPMARITEYYTKELHNKVYKVFLITFFSGLRATQIGIRNKQF